MGRIARSCSGDVDGAGGRRATLPAGTRLTVRVGSEISSGTARLATGPTGRSATRCRQWQNSGPDRPPYQARKLPRSPVDGCTLPES